MNWKSNRLIYQKYEEDDFDDFCDVVCNNEIMIHIGGKGNSLKVARNKFDDILEKNNSNSGFVFFKVSLLDGTHVGFAKTVLFDGEGVEIGYAILPSFWRKGYASEMIGFMKSFCRETYPDLTVMAVVDTQNIGSIKVLEKAGFNIYKKEVFRDDYCWFLRF
ncbi:MAG: hypothetical protein COB60_02925 [Flavobacteriaceae bacterium]|nr:MAG: hypothetical protein COB60_02925 [Flavobacteriaceae bacterium]